MFLRVRRITPLNPLKSILLPFITCILTYLLEKVIGPRCSKDIPGHFNIKTTELYTHLSKTKLITIISPLDDLWLNGDILKLLRGRSDNTIRRHTIQKDDMIAIGNQLFYFLKVRIFEVLAAIFE